MRLTLAHTEAIRVFFDTIESKKVLVNITYNAVQDTYYKERINPHTSTVTYRMSVFLPLLFTTYGNIDHDKIKEEEKKVLEIVYELKNPITKF